MFFLKEVSYSIAVNGRRPQILLQKEDDLKLFCKLFLMLSKVVLHKFGIELEQKLTGYVLSLIRASIEIVTAWEYICRLLKQIFAKLCPSPSSTKLAELRFDFAISSIRPAAHPARLLVKYLEMSKT